MKHLILALAFPMTLYAPVATKDYKKGYDSMQDIEYEPYLKSRSK